MITKLSEITKIIPDAQNEDCLFVLKPSFLNSYSNIYIKECGITFSFKDKRESWEKAIDPKLLKIKDNLFPNRDYNFVVMKSGRTFCRSGIPVALTEREAKYLQEITINWKIEVQYEEKDVIENYFSHILIRIVHKDKKSVFVLNVVDLPQQDAIAFQENRDCVLFGITPYHLVPTESFNTEGKEELFWSRTKGKSINPSHWSNHEYPSILTDISPFN